ncbi:M91 family zinc metallopeptidase [Pseudomonas sp. NPDC089407]|uniref:M91 family zinc metallopeptidase n=1 Tax=Pseudomonas sp. NPDC089407 TaxID=3364464 RepID=UPI0038500A1F
MPELNLSKLHSDPHPVAPGTTLANPNPIYYIDDRQPGHGQAAFDNADNPQQQTEVRYFQGDENVRITLERTYPLGRRYRRVTQSSELLVFGVAPRDLRSGEQQKRVRIAVRECLLEVTINDAVFMVAARTAEAIAIRLTDGQHSVVIAPEVKKPVLIDMIGNNNRIETGAGIVHIDAHTGMHQIVVGSGPVFIDKGDAIVNVTGHCLLGQASSKSALYRNTEDDARLAQPVAAEYQALGSIGVQVTGSDEFRQSIEDALELMRKLPCGQALLAGLDHKAGQSGNPINVTEASRHQLTTYTPSDNEQDEDEDHFIIDESRSSWGYSGGTLTYNPNWSTTAQLPLLDLYRCLCQGWNSMTGTVFPGQTEVQGKNGAYPVDNLQLQSIGLPTDRTFKFDTSTALNTNPPAFTENGLRQALQLELRTQP